MKKRNDFSPRLDSRRIARTLVLGAVLPSAACGGTSAKTTSATPTAHPQDDHHATHGGHAIGGSHAHRFDDAARWSKVFDDPARDEWQKPARVVEVMEIAAGMRVADVGAGTGYFE